MSIPELKVKPSKNKRTLSDVCADVGGAVFITIVLLLMFYLPNLFRNPLPQDNITWSDEVVKARAQNWLDITGWHKVKIIACETYIADKARLQVCQLTHPSEGLFYVECRSSGICDWAPKGKPFK